MRHSNVVPASSPTPPSAEAWRPRVPLGRALAGVLLLAVLSTAGFVHVIWERAASANVDRAIAALDAKTAGTVRADLTATLRLVEGTAEIIRSILFQGTIRADDEVKREFLFLSLLRAQPAIGWVGFGFPDGRFFGSHQRRDGKLEMVEIGQPGPDGERPLRRDIYRPLPGDVFFEERRHEGAAYVPLGSAWYRTAKDAKQPVWSVVEVLPNGFEPSVIVSQRVELYGRYQGVVMVAVSLGGLSKSLRDLQGGSGAAYVLDGTGRVLAASYQQADKMPARLRDFPADDSLALAADRAASSHREREFRAVESGLPIGPTYVSSFSLPFAEWRLLTATPRSDFAGEIDRSVRKVLLGVGALVLLASATALLFAHMLFARPFRRLSKQLRAVERFALDQVRHQPTFLAELDDFSGALKRMAVGIAAFARYMPLDVVKPLVTAGVEPVPDARLREITVLFADLPGFTSVAERLGPDVQPYLTSFLTLAVEAIHAEGGTVDKFIGDAVMAIWNAPEPIDDHALRACRAARVIHAAMHTVPPLEAGSGDGSRVRIGINTGTALVGNIGSDERLSYTAIGDTVNLASRLVGFAKEHSVEIVASAMTIAEAGSSAGGRPLGRYLVRGRVAEVDIYCLD